MKNSKLLLVLLLSVAPILCMDGFEAPRIEEPVKVDGDGTGPTEQQEIENNQNSDGQDNDEDTDNNYDNLDNQRSASGRSWRKPSTWFGGGKNSGGATADGITGQDGSSAITGGGATAQGEKSVTSNLERGLAPLGKWRDNTESLFEGWGEHTRTKVNEAFEYARQRAAEMFGKSEPEGQEHGLEVGTIRIKPDDNSIKYGEKPESQVDFNTQDKSPRRSMGEWFDDTFGRGTTRKKVQALETKADELEQQLGKSKNEEEQTRTLQEMSSVLDQLELSRRNLHRKWWQFSQSETELQKAQRGQGSQDRTKSNYNSVLSKKVTALRDILLTSGNLSQGLLDGSTNAELQQAVEVTGDEGDMERQQQLEKVLADRAQKELQARKTTDLLENVDRMLRNGEYKNSPEQRSELERYQQELERRYTEQKEIDKMPLKDRPLNDAMWFTDKEAWEKRRDVFNSPEYQNGTFNLDDWDASNSPRRAEPVRQDPGFRPVGSRPTEEDGPMYGPDREPQERVDAREAKERAELNAKIDKIKAQEKGLHQGIIDGYNARMRRNQGETVSTSPLQAPSEALERSANLESFVDEKINSEQLSDAWKEDEWKEHPQSTARSLARQAREYAERLSNNRATNDELLTVARRLQYIEGETKNSRAVELQTRTAVQDELGNIKSILKGRLEDEFRSSSSEEAKRNRLQKIENIKREAAERQRLEQARQKERISSKQMMNELNVEQPTQAQQEAYERARSKLSRYASERSNRRGRSRNQDAFESKYFGPLTEPQRQQLRSDYERLRKVGNNAGREYRDQQGERNLDGTLGAIRGIRKEFN